MTDKANNACPECRIRNCKVCEHIASHKQARHVLKKPMRGNQ